MSNPGKSWDHKVCNLHPILHNMPLWARFGRWPLRCCFLCFSPAVAPLVSDPSSVLFLSDALLRGCAIGQWTLSLFCFLWIKLLIVRSYPQPPSIIPLLENIFIVVIFALDPLQEGCAAYKKERWSELIGKFWQIAQFPFLSTFFLKLSTSFLYNI